MVIRHGDSTAIISGGSNKKFAAGLSIAVTETDIFKYGGSNIRYAEPPPNSAV